MKQKIYLLYFVASFMVFASLIDTAPNMMWRLIYSVLFVLSGQGAIDKIREVSREKNSEK
ncbi:hypothetical protein PEPCOX59622_00481 [Aedoeadaptatus coxii]|uniref:hypothetical protein n=1 Tax=Aedoeadaptatus coxii TaxID=755172 RepID=UPI00176E9B95|nr:hypothetical protein [Peptoniphilus coxii]CAC9929049.1 hypothetical protein PEPCOX59622_00481 [Peptoniphilus coxii]